MKSRSLLLLPLLAAAAVGGWYEWGRTKPGTMWLGYAEADYVRVAPVALGRVTKRLVVRGDQIRQGALLFTLDDTDETAARDQAAASLAQEREKLADLINAGRDAEIAAARADLADSQASYDRAERDLKRGEALVTRGDASQQSVDQARADALSARAHVAASQARLELISTATGREHASAAQNSAVTAAGQALASAQWRLDQRGVRSPVSGRVADTYVEPGETVGAGVPVLELLPPENILVRFFVPETDLARVHPGDSVALACDSCPSDIKAKISFIATDAQYAPPVIYSQGTRAALVYLIEARPDPAQATLFKPGQPLEVRPFGGLQP